MLVGNLHKAPRHSTQQSSFLVAELEEDGVRIALTIVDTPGFGDNIDNEFAYVTPRFQSSYIPMN